MGGYDVLLFDPYFCDLIVTGLPELPRLGADLFGTGMGIEAGGTFNTVRALHRLQARVGWVCDFGNDLFSRFVLSEVANEGVDTGLFRIHDKPVRVFSLAFSYAHDRGFISYMDPVEPVDRLPYIYEHQPRAILLNVLETGAAGLALARAAHEVDATVFLDTQATNATLETPDVTDMLRAADVLLLNASEAVGITGASSRDDAGRLLAELTSLVVLKCGADGAYAYQAGTIIHSPALRVTVVDTTGAGDCFNGGFIAARLRGEPLETCLRFGNICGGLSTTAHGAANTPTLDDVLRRIHPIQE